MKKSRKSAFYLDESENLHVSVHLTEDGKICRYHILKDQISRQAAAYASIKIDLTECKQSIEYLKSIKEISQIPKFVKTSLLFSSVILYAKCFSSGEGRGTSIQKEEVFKGINPSHINFHEEVIELRNKYLAHAGNSNHESRAVILILNPDLENKRIEGPKFAGIKLKDDDSNLDSYIDLFDVVISHVDSKFEKLKSKIQDEVDKLDINDIYDNSKLPEKDKFIEISLGDASET